MSIFKIYEGYAMNKLMSLVFFIIIFSLSACDNPVVDPEDLILCEEDSECIIVKKDCCGCSSGGESFSINIDYEQYWTNKQSEECDQVICKMVYMCLPDMAPACIEGSCKIISNTPE